MYYALQWMDLMIAAQHLHVGKKNMNRRSPGGRGASLRAVGGLALLHDATWRNFLFFRTLYSLL